MLRACACPTGPGIGRVPCVLGQAYAPPYKTDAAHVCNATERQFILLYGADFMEQFAPVLQSERNGCFLVSCIQHGINAAIDNVTNVTSPCVSSGKGVQGDSTQSMPRRPSS